MLAIERIDDPALLKQVAMLLAQENERLHQRIAELLKRLAATQGAAAQAELTLELAKLQERVNALQRKVFGESSEKRPVPAVEEPSAEPAVRRGHGPRAQPQLPVEAVPHDLPEADRKCPSCDGQLDEWPGQTEDAEEISVVERRFVVLKHQRKKYRCKCNGAVVTAVGPDKLIAGGRYSIEFAIEVAVNKYLDHLPLERQVRIMEREGLVVDSHTLWDQTNALARHLGPNYRELKRRILAAPFLHADETWWRLMNERGSKKWWSWCLATPDAVLYSIVKSRSAEAARALLEGYRGIVLTDGFGSYQALARASPGLTLAHCWAHVRREYFEIKDNFPEETTVVLDLIGELYAVEKLVQVEESSAEAQALRARLRNEKSRPVVERIRQWGYAVQATPESGLAKARDYMLGLWQGLVRFLDDPRIPLDNNQVERALRPMVVGRKNHYGSRSQRGTEVAALFYSLIETAKACGVEPKAYLLQAAQRAIRQPGSVLLPSDLAS